MMVFATLFDKNYMTKGIELYHSLNSYCMDGYTLYVLALDNYVSEFIKIEKRTNPALKIVDYSQIEETYPVLSRLKKERTNAEFCWTLTPYLIQFILLFLHEKDCIYVDADICFYSNPLPLLSGMKKETVLITRHNYSSNCDKTKTSGKFCVQFMLFKNNASGNNILEWWRKKCEENCTIDSSRGLCGDQKYLDDWESRFAGEVYIPDEIGCGVAPWNLQQYDIEEHEDGLYLIDKISKVSGKLFFFHFHYLLRINKINWRISPWDISQGFIQRIYLPYINNLNKNENLLSSNEKTEHPRVEEITLVKFYPIPLGLTAKALSYERHFDDGVVHMSVSLQHKGELGYVEYCIERIKGTWIRIIDVKGADIIRYWNDILWHIQKTECYSECSSNDDVVGELFFRMRNKEWVLTECPFNLLGNAIKHPAYILDDVFRVYKSDSKYFDISKRHIISLEEVT